MPRAGAARNEERRSNIAHDASNERQIAARREAANRPQPPTRHASSRRRRRSTQPCAATMFVQRTAPNQTPLMPPFTVSMYARRPPPLPPPRRGCWRASDSPTFRQMPVVHRLCRHRLAAPRSFNVTPPDTLRTLLSFKRQTSGCCAR